MRMVMKGYSKKCPHLTTRWDGTRCVPCDREPGHRVTPNCGYDDDGSQHVAPFEECEAGTFNDGSSADCQHCKSCPDGYNISSPCNTTTDTYCEDLRSRTTAATTTTTTITTTITTTTKPSHGFRFGSKVPLTEPTTSPEVLWAVPLVIGISILLVVVSACIIYRKRKRGQNTVLGYNRRSSYINAGFSSLSPGNNENEDILSPDILSAPLQTVLDNLDVLEELVILLDPESHGVKNTKHLASLCSFPATWINYTYSMKESRSPLNAVLEGVTSRNPDWTVGHLAKLLRHMERNDAIAVLAKLGQNVMQQV